MRTGLAPLVIGTMVAVALSVGASASSAAPSGSPTASPSPSTTLHLIVKGCEGCTIGVQRGLREDPSTGIKPSAPNYWSGPTTKVRNGVASLVLPTAYTSGASFTVSAPWEGLTDGMTNIVLGGGFKVGQVLTTAQATNRKRATACWAGTQASQARMHVTVVRRMMHGDMNKPVVFPIAWASPTVATVGPLSKTLGQGLLGNQDMYFC